MATESVKILIEAEDKASAKIAAATNAIENRIKSVKEVGGKAKASTEFIGTLAGSLGGSDIASYAGQLAGLTEKMSQFSEVSKLGGAGALAFKAGLAGAVGVLGFQVGNAIGNLVFETDKWNAELEKSIQLSQKMASELQRLADVRLGDSLSAIKLIEDPQKQIDEMKKLRDAAGKEVDGIVAAIAKLEKEKQSSSFDKDADIFGGALTNNTRNAEVIRELEAATAAKEAASARFLSLDKQIGDASRQIDTDEILRTRKAIEADADYLKGLDNQLSLLKAIQADSGFDFEGATKVETLENEIKLLKEQREGMAAIREQAKQSTSGNVFFNPQGDITNDLRAEAEAKLLAIKLVEKQTELDRLQREEKKAALKELADAEFAAVMNAEKAFQSERDRLAEQKVLLDKGAEAAHAFRLAKQGLSEEDAKSFAKQQTELDKQKQVQEKLKARETAAPLQAISSRFLTRGPTDDKMLDVAKTQLKVQQEQLVELKKPKGSVNVRDIRLVEVG